MTKQGGASKNVRQPSSLESQSTKTLFIQGERRLTIVSLVACLLLFLVGLENLVGQDDSAALGTSVSADVPLPTAEQMATLLDSVRTSTEITEESRVQLINSLTQAQQELTTVDKWREQATRYGGIVQGVGVESERVTAELNRNVAPRELLPESATREQLSQRQTELEAEIAKAAAELQSLEAEPARRQQRLTEIPGQLLTLREDERRSRERLAEPTPENESPLSAAVRMRVAQVHINAVVSQISALELETQAYTATSQLLPRQQELAGKRLLNLQTRKREIDERLRRTIALDSALQREAIETAAQNAVPELQSLASEVVKLVSETEAQRAQIDRLDRILEAVSRKQEVLREDLEYFRKRLDTVGLTTGLGALLRSKRSEVLRIKADEGPELSDQEELRSTQLKIFEVQEERQAMLGDSRNRDELIQSILRAHPELDPDSVTADVDGWFRKKLDELAKLETACQTHFERWVTIDSQRHELVKRCDEFVLYVEERVLWVRSAEPLGVATFEQAGQDFVRLGQWSRWRESVTEVLWDSRANLLFVPTVCAIVLVIAVYRGRLRTLMIEQGKLASKRSCQEFRPTLVAFGSAIVLGSLWPLLLWAIGWRLSTPIDQFHFLASIGEAVIHTAWFLWPIEILKQVTRPDGLGEHHFGWPHDARAVLRRYTRLFGFVAPILFLFAQVFYLLEENARVGQQWKNEAGRISFLALLMVSLYFSVRLLHPTQGALAHVPQEHHKSLWYRARFLLTFGVPLLLFSMILLAIGGYYYSSLQLAYRTIQSFSFLLVVAMISAMLRRWLFIRRRRLAIKQYRDRLESLRNRSDGSKGPSEAFSLELPTESEVDLASLSQQTRQLIHFAVVLLAILGVFAIWVDVLPALGVVGQVELWKSTRGGELVSVSIEKLTVALLTLVVMIVAAKNLPSLLEIMLLQHLPIDSGSRFAITTITRYLILTVGTIAGLSTLEIEWAQYSWLVAAATVGLGFGLQEIFANFISGLIMLVERPVKVGDVVTVDGVTGVVSRIQMRATTVTNWDHQDLIVPNKEFVTGKLLNWTLSNKINRVVLKVGVAYGSDTQLVTELLMKVAQEQSEVMKEPGPSVTFEEFGPSSLDFTLRCFLPTLDKRLETIHELHVRIDQAFRERGIEIAFPQQDLHIRSLDASLVDRLSPLQ